MTRQNRHPDNPSQGNGPQGGRDDGVITAFLDAMTADRGLAKNSIDAYKSDLGEIAAQFGEFGHDFRTADTDAIRVLLAKWTKQGLAPRTVSRRLSALRGMMSWLAEEGEREDNPCRWIDGPSRPSHLPKSLDEGEITRLLAAARQVSGEDGADEGATGTGTGAGVDAQSQSQPQSAAQSPAKPDLRALRMTAMLELLYATGLRVSELVTLPVGAFRRAETSTTVRGKGGRERLVFLGGPANLALARWIEARDAVDAHVASDYLFPAGRGHISRQAFAAELKQVAARAGIAPHRVSPHVVRHSFATHMLNRGANLIDLKTLLGHADISTTQIYTSVRQERLAGLVATAHPLANPGQKD